MCPGCPDGPVRPVEASYDEAGPFSALWPPFCKGDIELPNIAREMNICSTTTVGRAPDGDRATRQALGLSLSRRRPMS